METNPFVPFLIDETKVLKNFCLILFLKRPWLWQLGRRGILVPRRRSKETQSQEQALAAKAQEREEQEIHQGQEDQQQQGSRTQEGESQDDKGSGEKTDFC